MLNNSFKSNRKDGVSENEVEENKETSFRIQLSNRKLPSLNANLNSSFRNKNDEWNRTNSNQTMKETLIPNLTFKGCEIEEDNIQDPMSIGSCTGQSNQKGKSPFIKLRTKINKKTTLERKRDNANDNENPIPLKDLVISVDGTMSHLEDTQNIDIENQTKISSRNKQSENLQEKSITEYSKEAYAYNTDIKAKRKSGSEKNLYEKGLNIVRLNYIQNLNETQKKKNIKLITPSRNFTFHENKIARNDRYSNFGKTLNAKKDESLNEFVLPSISKVQQSSFGTSKLAKNSNSSIFLSDQLDSNIPFCTSSLKSNTNNDDTSESKSNDPPVSTPEFIETPLLSKQESANAKDFSSTSKSALSTFKRTAGNQPDEELNELKGTDKIFQNKSTISDRIANQIQNVSQTPNPSDSKSGLNLKKFNQLSSQITFCQHISPESSELNSKRNQVVVGSQALADKIAANSKTKIIQLKKTDKSRNANEEMKINFKTYQAALKDLRHFKQQADVFKVENEKLKHELSKYTNIVVIQKKKIVDLEDEVDKIKNISRTSSIVPQFNKSNKNESLKGIKISKLETMAKQQSKLKNVSLHNRKDD